MSPLLRKEIRLVLPACLLAVVLGTLPIWLFWPLDQLWVPPGPGALVFVPFAVGLIILGVASFGQELSSGMFPVLLVQPIRRERLWRTKVLVLGTAVLLILVCFFASSYFRLDQVYRAAASAEYELFNRQPEARELFLKSISEARPLALKLTLLLGAVCSLSAFSGGLWTTLLFRQMSAALWFAFLTPMALLLAGTALFSQFQNGVAANLALLALFIGYSTAGFFWGRHLFLHAQDAQWTGGTVALRRSTGRKSEKAGLRLKYEPLRALFRKELQFQQINFILAAGILVVHLAVMFFRVAASSYLELHRTLALALESFPLVWLAVPLVIGSVAVAEERRLGTLEALLCAPTNRRSQFFIKLAVALLLGGVLGGLLPVGVESIGSWFGLRWERTGILSSAALTLLAFYASSLATNTLQAMGGGVAAAVGAILVWRVALNPPVIGWMPLWSPNLLVLFASPVMTVLLILLAYKNFKHLAQASRRWVLNGTVLLLSVASLAAVTSLVHHRVWEAWLPTEPYRGPHFALAQYGHTAGKSAVRPLIDSKAQQTAVLWRNGNLWLKYPEQPWIRLNEVHWQDVAVSDVGTFALRENGTLWKINWTRGKPILIEPFGGESVWESIASGNAHLIGLKKDGTLWEWGHTPVESGARLVITNLHVPVRIGTNEDWIAIADSAITSAAVKADGSIWRWRDVGEATGASWSDRQALTPTPWLEWSGHRPVSLSFAGNRIAAVAEDGSLWLGGDHLGFDGKMVALSQERDWADISFVGFGNLVATTRGGRMVEWDLMNFPSFQPRSHLPSRYADWIAVADYRPGNTYFGLALNYPGATYLALAADGTLVRWRESAPLFHQSSLGRGHFLLPSRINAVRVTNIGN